MPFGVIPVGGAEVPTFMAYATEHSIDTQSKNPKFGTAMGALLAMGLPISATVAIMLAAFQHYGIQPGPLLFERNVDLVWPRCGRSSC